MAPHSNTLAWKLPWMEEPGGLQSVGSLRVGHDWATSLSLFTFMHWRRKWQPHSSVLAWRIPGMEPGGLPSMGSHRVGHDLAAAEITAESEGRREDRGNLISRFSRIPASLGQMSGDGVWQTHTWETSPFMRDSSHPGDEHWPVPVVLSHLEWHLRCGDLLQLKKFAILATPNRRLFSGVFFFFQMHHV